MRCYVAGKAGSEGNTVGGVIQALEANGHSVPYDWQTEKVTKPYLDNVRSNRIAADNMRRAVAFADVFILCWDERLLGGLVETGLALANREMPIFLIDPGRQSIYWTLRQVRIVGSHEELLDALGNLERLSS